MVAIKRTVTLLSLIFLVWSSAIGQKFSVSYTGGSSREGFTGKVFLYLSKDNGHPKDGSIGVERFPCYSISVRRVKPAEGVLFDDASLSYPVRLSDIERGEYYVQAVWDMNLGGRSISNSPGNMYSKPLKFNLTKDRDQLFHLTCDEVVAKPGFIETQHSKEVRTPSALLSAFYRRPTTIDAAVLLPREYDEQPARRFPVLCVVFGYGGDYHYFSGQDVRSQPVDTTPCIRVYLDGNCPLGHCVYANSDNNGPWGDALTQELIPAIEKRFRCNGARLLTGHSSGGWSVLWLQTHYPEMFAGCWASSPDPVDFRNFQQIDLYADRNMFFGKDGSRRMVAVIWGELPWVFMKEMYGAENVIDRGEQMHSFDAVFSTRDSSGAPRRLCNAYTGDIDTITVKHWQKYDISLYLRTNWAHLKASVDRKVRISVGNQDNFLLNYAVHLLDDEMRKLNAHFIFAYYPGDHGTVFSPEYRRSGDQFLQERYDEFVSQH